MDHANTLDQILREQQDYEWNAWGAVVVELRRLKVDLNKETKLHNALTRWGEELAFLRKIDPVERIAVLHERRERYPYHGERGEDDKWILVGDAT